MRQFLGQLGMHERVAAGAGALLLVLAALYAIVWHPLSTRVDRLEASVAEQRALRDWMQGAATEVRRLRGAAPAGGGGGQSLLALTDSTARQAGLGGALSRVEPEGADKVRIQLDQAGFDDLMNWLQRLAREFNVSAESVTVDNTPVPGTVNARLTLQGGRQ